MEPEEAAGELEQAQVILGLARRMIDYARANRGAPDYEAVGRTLSDAGARTIVERYGDDGLFACSVALDVLRAR